MNEKQSYNPFKSAWFYLVCGVVTGLASSTLADKQGDGPGVGLLALIATLCYGAALVFTVMYWANRLKKDKSKQE